MTTRTLLLLALFAGCESDSEPVEPNENNEPINQNPTLPVDHFPCLAAGGSGSGAGGPAQPGSEYAQFVVSLAAQIRGVAPPAGGVWSSTSSANASYQPNSDRIVYNPEFLTGLLNATGLLEAPDSVLFHEVGHMWVFKTGRHQCIGFGTVESNWRHEYQADSFAGAVLALLGGNPVGSIAVYEQVLAQWSSSHPPGSKRALVFVDGFTRQSPINMCTVPLPARLETSANPESILARLHEVRDALRSLDLDPYSSESMVCARAVVGVGASVTDP